MAQQATSRTNDVASTWYESVSDSTRITQGDIIRFCPVLIWRKDYFKEHDNLRGKDMNAMLNDGVDIVEDDVIVMTQACDLEQRKVSDVILCSILSIEDYSNAWRDAEKGKGPDPNQKKWAFRCKQIVGGFIWNLFMLNKCTFEPKMSQHVVNFHMIYTVPVVYLEEILRRQGGERLRLLPPYREHLSQAFARYFMRVGLPEPVDNAWPKLADKGK